MSAAEVSIRRSRLERSAGIGPAERLAEDVVEVVNEIEHASLEIFERGKACALEQSSREDGEPDLDLVEPRAVSWGVDEADPRRGILQERAARLLGLEDTGLAFDAEIFLNAATPGHLFDESGRAVGIELIGHEYPRRVRIGIKGGCDVGGEICFGSRRADRRADDFAGNDIEVRNQTQGPMSAIFELDTLDQARSSRLAFMQTFERLNAGFLIDAHDVCAFCRKLRRVAVGVADPIDVGLVLFGRFALVLRGKPVLAFMRSQDRSAKKRST